MFGPDAAGRAGVVEAVAELEAEASRTFGGLCVLLLEVTPAATSQLCSSLALPLVTSTTQPRPSEDARQAHSCDTHKCKAKQAVLSTLLTLSC